MNKFKQMRDVLVGLDNLPIYICGHITPDQDSICSSIALTEYLIKNNKNAKVLLRETDKQEIAWQDDYKNIVSKITDEKYIFIFLDANETKRLGQDYKPYFDGASYTINIDHHQNNTYEAISTLSIPGISSTCEIIYNIIKLDGKEIFSKKVCENLYAGMLGDTNGFSRRLSNQTLAIAQKLINLGADYAKINKLTLSSRSMYQFKALAKLVNEIKFDEFHYVVLDKEDAAYEKLTHNQIVKQIAEDLRKIEDIDTFLFLIKEDNKIVAKVMSNTKCNADQIAILFGGGGHKKEAGFTIFDTDIQDIVKKVKEFLRKN